MPFHRQQMAVRCVPPRAFDQRIKLEGRRRHQFKDFWRE